jgi:5-hydroxyisourate hydrolase-like protein (transthyretin family)
MAGLPVHLKPKFEQTDQRLFHTTETTSTAAGTFDLNNVAAGEWLIGTAHPDYAVVTESVTVPTTGPIQLSLGSRGGTITGHVYHKATGAAASGIPVALYPNSLWVLDKLDKYQATTAADGAYKFDHVSSGTRRIALKLEKDAKLGMALPVPPPIEVNEQETTDVTLFVYPGHTVTGRIYDKDTEDALPGAKVSVGRGSAEESEHYVSDAEGRYKVEHLFPQYQNQVSLKVDLEGFKPDSDTRFGASNISVVLSEDTMEATKDVAMVKTIKVSGIVVTRDEVPVPHAQVVLYDNKTYSGTEEKQVVNSDGSFELECAPFVSVIVEAKADGFGPVTSEQIEVTTKDVEGIKLVMDVGAVVQGVVLSPDGKPVAGAAVSENKSYGIFTTYREVAQSGENGEYLLRDVGKQLTVRAKKDGFAQSEELKLTLTPGETQTGADLMLRDGHIIAGRVVNASGQPVAGASISANGTNNVSGHENSDKDGKFEFDELVEGAYRLYASKEGENAQQDGVRTGIKDLELVIGKPGDKNQGPKIKFTGTVVDDLTGDPIREFTVKPSSTLTVNKLTEPGKFELIGVQRRFGYDLTISSEGYMEQVFDTDSSQDGSDVEQTFRLGKGGAITGRVVQKATGEPVPDVVVINWGTTAYHDRQRQGPTNHTTTDQEGKFTLAPAPSGKNTVQPKPPAQFSEITKSIEVKSEQVADIGDIELVKGGTITGIVVRGTDEEPVPNQNVSLHAWTQDLQVSKKASTDTEGRFEFTGLPAMNYTVQVENTEKSVELAAEGTADVKLLLGGVTIKGTVTRGGVPIRANISGRGPGGLNISDYTDSGEYLIKDAMPGTYNFSLHPQVDSNILEEVVEVPDQPEFIKNFEFPDGKINITVVNAAGEPVEGAAVSLARKSTHTGYDQRWLSRTIQDQRSDATGKVEFGGLAAGTYSASGRKEGVGTAMKPDIQVTDGQPAQAQLQLSNEGGTLVSIALSYATGQGVPEAWCYLHSENGPFSHGAKRDASGVMVIENIPPGTYTTNVSYWSHSQSEKQVEIKANETANIEDVLYPAGAINWTLKKADGSPAAGATVTVTPVTTDPPEEPRNGVAANNGSFVQRGLAGGTYQLTAQMQGKPAITESFNVQAGANEQKETTVPTW